jgi:hypothetical protein
MIKVFGNWLTIGNNPCTDLLKEYQHNGLRYRNSKYVVYIGVVVLKKVKDIKA